MTNKQPTSIRFSDEAQELRRKLSTKLGIDGTAVIELALRKLADAEGIQRKHPFRQNARQTMRSASRNNKRVAAVRKAEQAEKDQAEMSTKAG